MAHEYGAKVWKLDGDAGLTASVITTDRLRIERMEFIPNTSGDDVLVEDSAGDEVWRIDNALAGGRAGVEHINFGEKGRDTDGFVLTLSASCYLYVYLK